MKTLGICAVVLAVGQLTITALAAQQLDIRLEPVECLPNQAHAPIHVRIEAPEQPAEVRLYLRRLNPVGSFYYLPMKPTTDSSYGAVLPQPQDRGQPRLTERWWNQLAARDWLEGKSREWLAGWLSGQKHEAAEYFIAAHDLEGQRLAQSSVQLVPVLDRARCPAELAPHELRWARSISLGETVAVQSGRVPFHWSCSGVTQRITVDGDIGPDEACRQGSR